MTNFVLMGECMVEFSASGINSESDKLYRQTFAGDVLNTAIYLKRLVDVDSNVSIFTAVGDDGLSENMRKQLATENIDTYFVRTIKGKSLGAYLIELSETGERSFVYWRRDSAARSLFSDFNSSAIDNGFEAIVDFCDVFYFSGISLAIIENKERFWTLLDALKNANVQIVFDTNYRTALWPDKQLAITNFEKAFRYCDIIFCGVEDFKLLFGTSDTDEILAQLKPMDINEIILKDGAKDIHCISGEGTREVKTKKSRKVIDTTAAGDSFNAGYMAKRCADYDVSHAAYFGAEIASEVISHSGAIVGRDAFKIFLSLL